MISSFQTGVCKIVNTTREQLSPNQKVLETFCKKSSTGLRFSHSIIIKLEVFKGQHPNRAWDLYGGSMVGTVTRPWARVRHLHFSSAVYTICLNLSGLLNSSEPHILYLMKKNVICF